MVLELALAVSPSYYRHTNSYKITTLMSWCPVRGPSYSCSIIPSTFGPSHHDFNSMSPPNEHADHLSTGCLPFAGGCPCGMMDVGTRALYYCALLNSVVLSL